MLSLGSRAAIALALLLGVVATGCGGARHDTDTFWTGGSEGEPPSDRKKQRTVGEPDDFSAAPAPTQEATSTWVGVRHDLMLAPSAPRKERCSCLAVEVGEARDPKFQWAAGAPEIGADALAIALSAHGVPCPGGNPDEQKRRPSISAVDQEGNDIVVEVEELKDGRPLATGAVIPKPPAGGAIYVKGRSPKLPYARPAGSARCKVY